MRTETICGHLCFHFCHAAKKPICLWNSRYPSRCKKKGRGVCRNVRAKKSGVPTENHINRTPEGTAVGTTLSEQGPVGLSSPLSLGRERLCPMQRIMVCTSNLPVPAAADKKEEAVRRRTGIHRLVAGGICARWSRLPAVSRYGRAGRSPPGGGAKCPSPPLKGKEAGPQGKRIAGLDIGQARE